MNTTFPSLTHFHFAFPRWPTCRMFSGFPWLLERGGGVGGVCVFRAQLIKTLLGLVMVVSLCPCAGGDVCCREIMSKCLAFFFFLLGFLSGAFCGNSPNYFADIVVVAGESLICFYFSVGECGGGVCAGWFFLFGHLLLPQPFNEINYERGEQQLVAMKMKCHLLAATFGLPGWLDATICHRVHHNSTGMSLSMGPGTSCCSSGAFRFPFDRNFNKRTMTEV